MRSSRPPLRAAPRRSACEWPSARGPKEISWLILKRGLAQFAIGLAIGLPGALTVNRILRLGLADIGAGDPMTLAAILVILTLVAVAACLIPVRRATRLDPVIALRGE